MINFRSIKIQINLFLAVFAGFLTLKESSLLILTGFFWTVLFSVLFEGIWDLVKTRKFQITASALTSGLILGFVLSSGSPWWMFLAAAGLTIGLKHVLRFHGKNLLNPAALGIFLTVLLLQGTTEWKGCYEGYLLIPAGLYIIYKIKKMEIVWGYLAMSLFLFVPQALLRGDPLSGIPGYFNLFFIFIMLIEPKTTPPTRWPKVVFGAGAALLIFLLTEGGFRWEPELFALLVLNALVPVLNKVPDFTPKKKNPQGDFMKKIALFLCGLLVTTTVALAHPPSDIKIQFDPETGILTAAIKHRVSNPNTHYIKKADIGLNGKEVKTLTFTRQTTNGEEAVIAVISGVKTGDTLSVEGYCNQSGKLEKKIQVK